MSFALKRFELPAGLPCDKDKWRWHAWERGVDPGAHDIGLTLTGVTEELTGLGTLLVVWGNGLVGTAGCTHSRGNVNWTCDRVGVWRKSGSDGGSSWFLRQRPGDMEGTLVLAIWAPICAGWTGQVDVSYSHWARASVKSAIVIVNNSRYNNFKPYLQLDLLWQKT